MLRSYTKRWGRSMYRYCEHAFWESSFSTQAWGKWNTFNREMLEASAMLKWFASRGKTRGFMSYWWPNFWRRQAKMYCRARHNVQVSVSGVSFIIGSTEVIFYWSIEQLFWKHVHRSKTTLKLPEVFDKDMMLLHDANLN